MFDNGMFAARTIAYEDLGDPILDSGGDINLRDGTTLSGREIYEEAVHGLFDPERRLLRERTPGPWFQIRK